MWGLSFFFQHLKKRGLSQAAMANYLAAILSLSFASGAPNQWERFPQLRTMCEGLKKQVGTPASRNEGVTINIFKAVFEFWETSERTYRAAGNGRLADNALRNATQLCLGFFSLCRASELFVSASGHMGLRIRDVDVVEGSHVTLFIRKQKKDSTNMLCTA